MSRFNDGDTPKTAKKIKIYALMSSVTLLLCGGQARSNKNRSATYAIAAQNKNNKIVTEYDKNLPPVIIVLLLKGITISIKIGMA